MDVKIKLVDGGRMPEFKTEGAVCADCYARLDDIINIPVNERCLIPLGFAMQLPENWEAVIRPRSGLTSKGIDSGIGTIDWDYTGEIKACLINHSHKGFVVHDGDRICQLAVRPIPSVRFKFVDELSATKRGENGFGSTGI